MVMFIIVSMVLFKLNKEIYFILVNYRFDINKGN